jgi:hypothetical protein
MSTTTMKERLAAIMRRIDQREAQAEVDELRVEAEFAEACEPFITAVEAGLRCFGPDTDERPGTRSRHR